MTLEKRKRDEQIRTFKTVKLAEAHIRHLEPKNPGRRYAVLDHPRRRRMYAIGIMAGGWLLCGWVA